MKNRAQGGGKPNVNSNRENLEREFVCPKCRGRGALVQEVALGRSVAMIPLGGVNYLTASCRLCGYTEFYNLAVCADADVPVNTAALSVNLAEKS